MTSQDPTGQRPVSAALTDAPILAHVVRDGIVESVHRATVVVTAPDGSIDRSWGDPSGLVFARSSNKPLQATGMVACGLDLPDAQLALGCASHSGETIHVEAARAILAGAGLEVTDLQNTPDYPLDEASRDALVRAGTAKAPIYQNCSGKHAAMLATCVSAGYPTDTYLDPDHPLQRAITATVEQLTGEQVAAVVVDGCGAPLHLYPLVGLARAFGRIAAAPQHEPDSPQARVAGAIQAAPQMLGGHDRDVTALIRSVPGLVAKDGAESVYAVGLADGRGVAVKVADGFPRAKGVILAAVLRRLGVDAPAGYLALENVPVLGHGRPVGAVVAAGDLASG